MNTIEQISDYDYFVDNQGYMYIVKGYHHPENRVKSALLYIPTPDNHPTQKLHRDTDRYYARLIDELGDVYCHRNISRVSYTDPITKDSFIAVPKDDIDFYYGVIDRRDKIEHTLRERDPEHPLFMVLDGLKEMGISNVSVGFFGSLLVNMETDLSDTDLVIYSQQNYRIWQELSENYFNEYLVFPGMNESRYRDFIANYPLSFDEATNTFGKRHCPHKLQIGKFAIDVRFAYSHEEIPPEERCSPVSEVKYTGIIEDSDKSAYCPAEYTITVEESYDNERLDHGSLSRVLTYRHNYRHLFKPGEEVSIYGMLTNKPKENLITLERYQYYITEEKNPWKLE